MLLIQQLWTAAFVFKLDQMSCPETCFQEIGAIYDKEISNFRTKRKVKSGQPIPEGA
jgi:hypothetical protein